MINTSNQSQQYLPSSNMLLKLPPGGVQNLSKQLNKLTYTIGVVGQPSVRYASSSRNPQNLPLQPVPKLKDTVDRYLKSLVPLLNPRELCQTEIVLNDFICPNGQGEMLQKLLEERKSKTENWLLDWWLEVAYLGFRSPVVVYSSPGQAFPLQCFRNDSEWLFYTSQLIVAAATFKSVIDKKQIPEEKMGKDPLDMNQYNLIFGTCRIPLPKVDGLQYNPDSNHIIVCHNNQFFQLQIFDSKNKCVPSVRQIFNALQCIVSMSQCPEAPIGILSGTDRDSWASAYISLMTMDNNRCSISQIQKSLFLVCLDQCISPDGQDNRKTMAGKQLIHGGGPLYNAGNRWFDKTIQFVVSKDGIVGLTYEHSPSEGQPVANMVDYVHMFIEKKEAEKIPDNADIKCNPIKLSFCLNEKDRINIANAQTTSFGLTTNLDLNVLHFTKYGKNFIKKQKLSPDSYIQMAFQYTYYRMYGRPAPQYESAAARKYLHGRTETIRSCSIESVRFAQTMCSDASYDDKAKALREAIKSHKEYTIAAVNGFGVDRHLLGLKKIALKNCFPLPYIFEDVSYKRSTHFLISSSQVATKCDGFMCYGPTSFNGYGCCYNPRDDDINIAVSCITWSSDTSSTDFVKMLDFCLQDMKCALDCSTKSKL